MVAALGVGTMQLEVRLLHRRLGGRHLVGGGRGRGGGPVDRAPRRCATRRCRWSGALAVVVRGARALGRRSGPRHRWRPRRRRRPRRRSRCGPRGRRRPRWSAASRARAEAWSAASATVAISVAPGEVERLGAHHQQGPAEADEDRGDDDRGVAAAEQAGRVGRVARRLGELVAVAGLDIGQRLHLAGPCGRSFRTQRPSGSCPPAGGRTGSTAAPGTATGRRCRRPGRAARRAGSPCPSTTRRPPSTTRKSLASVATRMAIGREDRPDDDDDRQDRDVLLGRTHRLVAVVEGAAHTELDVALLGVGDRLGLASAPLADRRGGEHADDQAPGDRRADADLAALQRAFSSTRRGR